MFASYGAFGFQSEISSRVSVNLSKLLSTKPNEGPATIRFYSSRPARSRPYNCSFLLQDRGLKFKALCKHNKDSVNPPGTRGWNACGSPGKRGLAAKLVWNPLAFAVVRHTLTGPKLS